MKDIKDFLKWYDNENPAIPETYFKLLDNIENAEGGHLHRNKKEADITTGFGIYKTRHPRALIWRYIDHVAASLGNIPKDTSMWTRNDINKVQDAMDDNIELYLSYVFYNNYFKRARLELFDLDIVITMANLYTNSQTGAWKSVQEAIRDMYKYGLLDVDKSEISIVDGVYGGKTRKCLRKLKNSDDFKDNIIFKTSMLLAMKSYYTDLAVGNPDKFLGYANGWDNRMEMLQHSD